MPPGLKRVVSQVGIPGAFLLAGSILLLSFILAGREIFTIVDLLAMMPFGIWLAIRGLRALRNHSLWSVRNRLLFVYGLFGALPLLLIITLVSLGSWALMNELAIYLATSALERRLQTVEGAAEAVQHQPVAQRSAVLAEIGKAFSHTLPGITFFVKDESGEYHYPGNAHSVAFGRGWKTVHGLLVHDHRFYGWAHSIDGQCEVTALVPVSDAFIQSLAPNLGTIGLLENPDEAGPNQIPASAGSLRISKRNSDPKNPDYDFGQPGTASSLPESVNFLDVPVTIASTLSHYHLDSPGKSYSGILTVRSRPSAVLQSFFSGSDLFREILIDGLLAIAILFLIVELIAIWIGVSLSRRITAAVNQLYEGTRRVISGDFGHRILVRDNDQLGDLAQSFNQMTGNLERLLVVEKEKERLQTEVEIAREVQGQLYPKAAPPTCGLKLTVRCDPARMVSGDYYDYLQVADGRLVFAIGDVAGKGISAALLMATLQAALRAQVTSYVPRLETECSDVPQVDVARLVSKLNKQIHAHTSPEKYATFFFAAFDEGTCSLTYTNAGHLAPLLFRGDQVIPLDSNGTVVGAFPFAQYDESCLAMSPGDLLVCYTDGITEPENAYGEMFGEERLIALVQKHWHQDDVQIIDIVLDAVRGWTGMPELHDDMTLMLARQVGAGV